MEAKTKKGTNTKSKTKREIEAAHPIIKPEDCPGAVMDWVVERDKKRDEHYEDRDKDLVLLIEQTIDRLFEKHFRKYVTMIYTNRTLSILALVGLGLWSLFLIYYLSKSSV